jgi:hypothetical protein
MEQTTIATTQSVHLQPADCAINPPIRGPITGPINMPPKKTDIILPFFAGRMQSAMLPPPMFIGPPPTQPAINRKTMKQAIVGAAAQATVKARKRMFVIL